MLCLLIRGPTVFLPPLLLPESERILALEDLHARNGKTDRGPAEDIYGGLFALFLLLAGLLFVAALFGGASRVRSGVYLPQAFPVRLDHFDRAAGEESEQLSIRRPLRGAFADGAVCQRLWIALADEHELKRS